jgi:DNA invertase Pin-like site-specific DNA recombinase
VNTKHLLKEPLKIQATYGASSLPVGTEIETTDREAYFGTIKCRVVLADGREHLAYRADIDEAIKPRVTQGKLGIRVFDNDCFGHANIEKIALYARVRTKDRRQDVENQLIALREHCAKQGWEIASEYIDHETGGTSKRPRFLQMFADARQRQFDLVLFWSLDRLSREGVRETLNHLEQLTAAGVGWRSFTEEYLDSCGLFRDAVLAVLATIAKQDRIGRSERAAAAIARLKRQGHTQHLGRPRMVVDGERAKQLHGEGWSVRRIAAELGVSVTTMHRVVKEVG